MKKFVSAILAFAVIIAMFSLTGFAAESGCANDVLGQTDGIISDGMHTVSEFINSISFDIMYIEGLNDFLSGIDTFLESVVNTIIDFVVQIMDTFTF